MRKAFSNFAILLVLRIKNHLSSFEPGFLNTFSRQNLCKDYRAEVFLHSLNSTCSKIKLTINILFYEYKTIHRRSYSYWYDRQLQENQPYMVLLLSLRYKLPVIEISFGRFHCVLSCVAFESDENP